MGIFSRLFGRKKTAEEKVPEVREIPETEAHPEVHEMPETETHPEVHEMPEAEEHPEVREIPETEEHPEVHEMPEAETQPGTRGVPEAREAEGFEAMDRETVLAQTVQRLKEKTLKPVIHIDLHAEPAGLTDSKLGGVPYLPADGEVPTDKKGRQLRLLAQLRLAELPENTMGLPEEGILQFWILDDDLLGLETDPDQMMESKGHRVVWYPSVDETVTEESVLEKYHPYFDEESSFPMQDVFRMTFTLAQESLSYSDFRFDRAFAQAWNEVCPSDKITGYRELDVEMSDAMMDAVSGAGHKIGGYPMFTQWDPREGKMENYGILLLQIDSFGAEGKEIMWGDSGVGNFFITPEDLEQRAFSRVLYTWDCY